MKLEIPRNSKYFLRKNPGFPMKSQLHLVKMTRDIWTLMIPLILSFRIYIIIEKEVGLVSFNKTTP